MRPGNVLIFASIVVPLVAGSHTASAQGTVNDRLENRPFAAGSRAESYVGLTMTQLVVALGLRLKGMPPEEVRERLEAMRTGRADGETPPAVAAAPTLPHTSIPAPSSTP
jgi:hypothetical protein